MNDLRYASTTPVDLPPPRSRQPVPAQPLAVGDVVVLGYGRGPVRWQVAELSLDHAKMQSLPTDNRIRPSTRYVSWLDISRGKAVRVNQIPITEATHA